VSQDVIAAIFLAATFAVFGIALLAFALAWWEGARAEARDVTSADDVVTMPLNQ